MKRLILLISALFLFIPPVNSQQTASSPSNIMISEDGSTWINTRRIIFDGATITSEGGGVYRVSFGTVTSSFLLLEDGTSYLLQEDGTSKIIL